MSIKSHPFLSGLSLKYVVLYRVIPILIFVSIISVWLVIRGEAWVQSLTYFLLMLIVFFFVVAIDFWMSSNREIVFNGVIEYKIFGKSKFISNYSDISVSMYKYDGSIVITPRNSMLGIRSARFSFLSDYELNNLCLFLKDHGVAISQKTKANRLVKSCAIIVMLLLFHWGGVMVTGAFKKDVIQSFVLFFYPAVMISVLASLRCIYDIDIRSKK